MNGYEVVYNGTLEREWIRSQQRHVVPEKTHARHRQLKAKAMDVLRREPGRWWTVREVLDAIGEDMDRTWLNTLLRDFYWRGQLERAQHTRVAGGHVWRYRVKS